MTKASPARTIKLAEKVARQILLDIRNRGWPVGELLGTEAKLIERYKVSRATLGEAIRQLEMQGAVYMQRGPRGGLTVAAPAREAIVKTIASYLDFADVSLYELFEAFQVIESHSVMAAAHNAQPEDIEKLKRLVAEIDDSQSPQEYYRRLMAVRLGVADATGNQVISLFMRVLARVLTHLVWRSSLPPKSVTSTMTRMRDNIRALVDAIADGDGPGAQEIIHRYLSWRSHEIDKMIRQQRRAIAARVQARSTSEEPGLDRGYPDDAKAADRLARAIIDDIRHGNIEPGKMIGQEKELIKHYGTSRWVVRQAIRMLEVQSVLRSKRGQGGGVRIARPDPEYAIATAETYLSAIGMRPEPFADLWFNLLTSVAKPAARCATPDSVQPLRDHLAFVEKLTFEDLRSGLPNFYFILTDVAKNKVFRLIMMIIARYLMNFKVRVSRPDIPEEMFSLLHEITQAIDENDEVLAHERMMQYVRIVRDYIHFVPVLAFVDKGRPLQD